MLSPEQITERRKHYQKRLYTAIDVKIKRNAKLKIDRKLAKGKIDLPIECQKRGCSSTDHKIIFRSYQKEKFLSLCSDHVIELAQNVRKSLGFGGDGLCWHDEGISDARYGKPIEHHLYPSNYYQGYRESIHGDSHAVTKLTVDVSVINLSTSSKRYW